LKQPFFIAQSTLIERRTHPPDRAKKEKKKKTARKLEKQLRMPLSVL